MRTVDSRTSYLKYLVGIWFSLHFFYFKLDTYLHAHYISTAFTINFLTNDIYTGIHFETTIYTVCIEDF